MKRIYLLAILCAIATASFAQEKNSQDSAKAKSAKNDTIRIGSIIIIKKHKGKTTWDNDSTDIVKEYDNIKSKKKSSTNYFIFDIGFANWNDQTIYSLANSTIINRPGVAPFSKEDLKLRAGKSVNINLWFFMQKISLVKNNVNLKYGLGVEWNNYNFRSPVSLRESGLLPNGSTSNAPFIYRDSISFSKNKLNVKYLSVPLMLNFTSNKKKGTPQISGSVGVSASYLIRQRNKQNSNERGKQKNQGDFNMEKFKLSYIAELGLGSTRLYGSYTPKSIFENNLNVRPFTFGIRFSNW
jgi:Outer membrane protein beta-barrel domain